jgi:hypothetical protein
LSTINVKKILIQVEEQLVFVILINLRQKITEWF